MKNKLKIYTLGCKVNRYDSDKLAGLLLGAGFKLVEENADVAIINTCCVTKSAISKDKRMIKKAQKENPEAKIVIMGCWSKTFQKEAEKQNMDLIWGVGELEELVAEILKKIKVKNKSDYKDIKLPQTSRTRYSLKIQDGCEQFCSYCIIPYNRGKLKSRKFAEVLAEAQEVAKNYKEIVLCGIHLGLFGREKNGEGTNLVKLLKELVKIKGLERIRLSSIEVTEVDDDLIDLMADEKKICQHLHIPLQSGSDKILKLMKRPYTKKYFQDRVKKLRKKMPDIAITTDVMVGFPDESEKDFKEICEFVREIEFSKLHVFPFSAHEKTLAYTLPNQLDKKTKLDRAKVLRKIGEDLEKKYRDKFRNRELEIIVEQEKNKKIKGKTEFYFGIEVNNKDHQEGDLIKVVFDK